MSDTPPLTRGVEPLGPTVDDPTARRDFLAGALGWQVCGGTPDAPPAYVTDAVAKPTHWQQREPGGANLESSHDPR